MRKSTVLLTFFLLNGAILFYLLVLHPIFNGPYYGRGLAEKRQAARELQVTDLCLFTEARYTRHLSMADLHSAFQDFPVSLEHFPSGSMAAPPRHLRAWHERRVEGLTDDAMD